MRTRRFNNEGFSVAEVLVAATLVGVVLLSIATIFPTAATTIDHTGGMARATALAQQRIEQLKNVPFATLAALNTANIPLTLPASEEQNIAEGNDTFTRRAWVQVSGAAPRREATVTVMLQWAAPTGTKTLRLDTMIAEES